MVAGHCFRLSFSKGDIEEKSLSNYAPFLVSKTTEEERFHLSVVKSLSNTYNYQIIGQFDDDIASIQISKSENGHFRIKISPPGSDLYSTMDADSAFRTVYLQLPSEVQHRFFCLNNCLMLLYTFSSAPYDTLLLHASVVRRNNDGFVFLGKSGTGKSTHSSLWINHIEGSELLNDDNPVVRIIEGIPMVFGSPWSGKTPCYRNEKALLKGIVKLHQAPKNQIRKLSVLEAYASVFPSCSNMKWEEGIAEGIHRTVEKLSATVACYQLDCLPDKEAAMLSSATLTGL